MKKRILLILLLAICILLIASSAVAELSTNLFIKTAKVKNNQRLTDSETYVDAAGNVVVPSDKGYATKKYTYGTGNRVASETFLDANGRQVNSADGYCIKTYRYSLGRVTETRYYDKDNKPVNGPEGYARQVTTYNARKHISTWQYDSEGNITGVHRLTEYNKQNRVKAEAWYDKDNNPTAGPDGYARVEYEYFGKTKSKIAYYGPDGKPFFNAKDKYAIMEKVYKNGKIRSTHYYGDENQLIAGPNGYAYVLYTYGNPYVTEMYYNADGSLFFNDKGVCGIAKTPQKNGKTTQYYLVGDGVRGNCVDGYSMTKIEYSKGRVAKQGYYDVNDHLMVVPSLGYAQIINYYVAGGVFRTFYFDENGKRALGPDGYAMVENTYLKRKLVRKTFYDTDKTTKINGKNGYAQIVYVNEGSNPISKKYYTADGKPCLVNGLYDEIRNTWSGNLKTSESYWADGKKVAGTNKYHEVIIEYNAVNKESKKAYLNENDELTLCADGYAITEIEYNSAGGIMCQKYYDADGQLTYAPGQQYAFSRSIPFKDMMLLEADEEEEEEEEEEEGSEETETTEEENGETEEETQSNEAVDINNNDDGMIIEYHGLDGKLINIPAGYAYIVREKNAKGFITAEKYYDAEGNPVMLAAGYAVIKKEYNDTGMVTSESYYDTEGNKTACKDGYDEIRKEYNKQNQAIRQEYCVNGMLSDGTRGYSIIKREFDAPGLEASVVSYYNEKDMPVMNKSGYHKVVKSWADKTHATSEAWFDTEGQPVRTNNNYVRIEREYDKDWNITAERYYGADGEPIPCTDGYDELRKQYNNQKQAVRQEYYLDGVLSTGTRGYAIVLREYEAPGLEASVVSYYNEKEEPVLNRSGYHKAVKSWADKTHATSEAWFDTEGQPVTQGNTYVKVERDYDKDWNTTAERYYGADGELIPCTDGYDEIRKIYNDQKQMIRQEYYMNGALSDGNRGYAIIQREYDAPDQDASVVSYFNAKGEPVLNRSGYHKAVKSWADKTHATSEAWFDAEGQPVTQGNTYVKVEREYDKDWNITAERYYGADGELIPCTDGYDEIRKIYNDQKQAIRQEYYVKGALADGNRGYAIILREYEAPDQEASVISYYNEKEEPVLNRSGYHKVVKSWADKTHANSEAWFDAEGQPVTQGNTYVKVEREYDKDWNTMAERYYGADGDLIPCAEGYDEIRKMYNDQKQAIRQEYYVNGSLSDGNRGYAIILREYEAPDQEASVISYYNEKEEPVLNRSGYHKIVRFWADKTHATSEAWFDTVGQPVTQGNTYVKVEREYDKDWNIIAERYYGADGELIPCKDGYDEIRKIYNDQKQVIRQEYYVNGALSDGNRGYAIILKEYEAADQEASVVSYYNEKEEPVLNRSGYHKVVKSWADKTHATSEAWFDTQGQPASQGNTYVKVEREYDKDWNTTAERYYGVDGELIPCTDGYDEIRKTYNDQKQAIRQEYYVNGALSDGNRGYAIILREYEAPGLEASVISYYNEKEEPVLNRSGYHKIVRSWADKTHATSEAWFDAEGQPVTQGNTYVKVEREYDKDWNTTTERYYGADGEPIPCTDGYDEIRKIYNNQKQVIRQEYYVNGTLSDGDRGYAIILREYEAPGQEASVISYYNAKEDPVLNRSGYHKIVRSWADKSHVTSEAWFDAEGQPVTQGNTYVKIEREYDKDWNTTAERYYGVDSELIPCTDGYDEIRKIYNDQKQAIRQEYYVNGALSDGNRGYAIILKEYEAADQEASVVSYYNEKEEPVLNRSGYHKVVKSWADKTHATSEAWFDTEGQPVTQGNTYVKVEREYDKDWNTTAERYYGADGELILCTDGYDELRKEYNDQKQAVRQEYYVNGALSDGNRGYAIILREYEVPGQEASVVSYFNAKVEPVLNRSGYHKAVKSWADKTHATSEAWFDAEGQPVTQGNTYVKVEREYDKDWNITAERYYGADGELIPCTDGYDEIRRIYNDQKQAIRQEYYVNGALSDGNRGYAIIQREYEVPGQEASVVCYYNANEEPVLNKSGYHKVVRSWADSKHISSEAWFDEAGQPKTQDNTYVKYEKEYDGNWNTIAERYYGPDGKLIPCKDGYDEVHREFDALNHGVRYEYYVNGELVLRKGNYAVMTREYDEKGFVAVESFYGTDVEPVLCANGYHSIKRTWYDKDHVKSEAWFDTEENPMTLGNTFVRREREYDEAWNITVERYYGPDGEKIPCKDGYDEIHRKFNELKQAVRFAYFLNGEPFVMPAGYSVMKREYEENGFVAKQSYFDADDVPVLSTAGYHAVVRTWYDKDHAKTEMWFDTEGKPMTLGNTYCGVEREYDEAWNVKTEKYLDAEGKPIARTEGYDEVRKTFNEQKKPVRFEYYLGGEPYVMSKGYTAMEREYGEDGTVTAEKYFDAEGKEIIDQPEAEK